LTLAPAQPLGVGDAHVLTAHAHPLQQVPPPFRDWQRGSVQEAWDTSLVWEPVPLRGHSLPLVLACRDIGVEEAVPPDIEFADSRPEDVELASSGSTWSSHWGSHAETIDKALPTTDLGLPVDTEPPQRVHISSKVKAVEGFYELNGNMHNDRPAWSKVATSPMHLFFSSKHGKWYISDKFEDNGFTYGVGMALCPRRVDWANNTSIVQASVGKPSKGLRGTSCPPAYSAEGRNFLGRLLPNTAWASALEQRTPATRRSHSGEALSEGSVGTTASSSSGVQERRGMGQLKIKTEG